MKFSLPPKTVLVSTKNSLRDLHNNWILSLATRFVIALTVLSFLLVAWRYRLLPPQIPLWYAKPWGAERLAEPFWLFILPVGGILWHTITILMGLFVTNQYLVFTQLLFINSLLVSLLSFITLVNILFIVS